MRIISGKLKGKSIDFLKNLTTRPLKDSVKENIFNILMHSNLINSKVEKSNILDLYSGIGSFGLECISRGANHVTFVEKNKEALEILKENLTKLSISNQASILEHSIENIFDGFDNNKKKFDVFFLDPPFADDKFIQILNLIKKKELYNNKHIIIVHRERESCDVLDKTINTLIVKEYGRSKIIFGVFK